MIKDEVGAPGGSSGSRFVRPTSLGGNALTALYFMLQQSFWLWRRRGDRPAGQAVVIPKLRKKS